MTKRLSYGLLLVALILIGLLRFPFSGIPVFNVDEAVSAVVAQEITEGGLPYRDAIDHRGPLTYYAYAGVFQVFGDWNMTAVHHIYVFLLCLMAVVLFWLDSSKGAIAAVLFAIYSWAQAPMDMWAAHTEWLLILFSLSAMGLLLCLNAGRLTFVLAGICLGIAALSKQVAVWDLAAVLGWIVWVEYKQAIPWTSWIIKGVGVVVGFLIPLLGMAIYFHSQGAWEDFLFYVWEYNVQYYLPEVSLLERIGSSMALLVSFFGSALLLAILIFAALYDAWFRIKDLSKQEKLLLCWLGGAMLGGLTSGRNFGHYAIQWLPAASLVAAWGLSYLWQQLEESKFHKGRHLMGGMLILGLLLPLGHTLVKQKVYLESAFHQDPQVAVYIRDQSEPTDRLFVWGFAPEFYLYTQRRPATRYVYCNVLTGLIPWENLGRPSTEYAVVPGTREQLMQDLQKHPPAFVLDTSPADYNSYGKYPLNQYPDLFRWLQANYHRDTVFAHAHPHSPFHLYRRHP